MELQQIQLLATAPYAPLGMANAQTEWSDVPYMDNARLFAILFSAILAACGGGGDEVATNAAPATFASEPQAQVLDGAEAEAKIAESVSQGKALAIAQGGNGGVYAVIQNAGGLEGYAVLLRSQDAALIANAFTVAGAKLVDSNDEPAAMAQSAPILHGHLPGIDGSLGAKPQNGGLNGGPWKVVENAASECAKLKTTTYTVAPLYSSATTVRSSTFQAIISVPLGGFPHSVLIMLPNTAPTTQMNQTAQAFKTAVLA